MDNMTEIDTMGINNIESSLAKPEVFREQLLALKERIGPMLEDFIKFFILYHKSPSNSEYINVYQSIIQNINSLMTELFNLSNNVEKNTEIINKYLLKLNKLIEKEKKLQQKMKRILVNLNNAYNGSDQMIDEYVEMYNIAYMKISAMVLGILILGFSMSKIFSSTTINK